MGMFADWKTTTRRFHFLFVAVVVLTNFADAFTTVVRNGNSNRWLRKERTLNDRPRQQQAVSSLSGDSRNYTRTIDEKNVNIQESFRNKHEKKWMQQYEKLKSFQKTNGNCNVPRKNPSIGMWVNTQRRFFKEGILAQERIDLLNAVGFTWTVKRGRPLGDNWDEKYEQLKEFRKEHGHFSAPLRSPLYVWMLTQRRHFREGILSKHRIVLLEEIGFSWSGVRSNWQEYYNELKDFHKIHGHVDVPLKNYLLNRWVRMQRMEIGNMDPDKVEMLDRLGLVWEDVNEERNERRWNARWEELKEFQKIHGHLTIPVGHSLYRWPHAQRSALKQGRLSDYRKKKLDSIGFVWRTRGGYGTNRHQQDRWLGYYKKLKNYRSEHGHFNVKRNDDDLLRKWVFTQRREFKYKFLRKDRQQLLEEIDFVWDARKEGQDERWRQKFDELRAFHKEFGHLQVKHTCDKSLYFWLKRQRRRFELGRLEPERQAMLDDLDTEWTKSLLRKRTNDDVRRCQ